MKRLAWLWMGALGATLLVAACSDDPKKRRLGETCGSDSDCGEGQCLAGYCLDPEADEDFDELTNRLEGALGSNPLNQDSDYDGVPDGAEVDGTDPRDTDGDGIPDIVESLSLDADKDCLPDELDPDNTTQATDLQPAAQHLCSPNGVCRSSIGSVRIECDANKVPHCIYDDIATYEADETTCDGLDNDCDGKADEGFADSDGDDTADCADSDGDGDGITDGSDNCPDLANAGQDDADGDNAGDACDAPTAPSASDTSPASPNKSVTPTLNGAGEKLSIVRVFTNDQCTTQVGQGAASASGTFSVQLTLTGTGRVSLYLQAENSAGLKSGCVLGLAYEIDQTVPAGASDLAARATEWTEDDADFEITGTAEALSAVDVFADASCTGEGTRGLATDGHFSIHRRFPNTTTTFGVRVTDIAGNQSGCITGPALFGEIRVQVMRDGAGVMEQAVQFHYPDGSPALYTTTDAEGIARANLFAGCGATTLRDSYYASYGYVSVFDLAPGQTVPVKLATLNGTSGWTVYYTWPAIDNAYFIKFFTRCYSYQFYLDGQTEAYVGYYDRNGCLDVDSFATLAVAYDYNYQPIGYASSVGNTFPIEGYPSVTIGEWLSDFGNFTVQIDNIPDIAYFSLDHYRLEIEGGTFSQFYGGSDVGTGEIELDSGPYLPKHPLQTFDFYVSRYDIAPSGSSQRSWIGHEVAGATQHIDASDMLPRVLDSYELYEQQTETTDYFGWGWNSENGVAARTDVGLLEGYVNGPQGSIEWSIVLKPRDGESQMLFPELSPDFPGAITMDDPWGFDGNVTWWEHDDVDGWTDFVTGCTTDIINCVGAATGEVARFTSCCSGGGNDAR